MSQLLSRIHQAGFAMRRRLQSEDSEKPLFLYFHGGKFPAYIDDKRHDREESLGIELITINFRTEPENSPEEIVLPKDGSVIRLGTEEQGEDSPRHDVDSATYAPGTGQGSLILRSQTGQPRQRRRG